MSSSRLRAKGAQILDEPTRSRRQLHIFLSHGVASAVRRGLLSRPSVHRATCPLVPRCQRGASFNQSGAARSSPHRPCGHPRSKAQVPHQPPRPLSPSRTRSPSSRSPTPTAGLHTQTTLSVDDTRSGSNALKARFPPSIGPDTKTSATRRRTRHRAARELAGVTVVPCRGLTEHSNSKHGCARSLPITACPELRIEDALALDMKWLEAPNRWHHRRASAPIARPGPIAKLRERGEWNWFKLPG